jgi:hypothetical protein
MVERLHIAEDPSQVGYYAGMNRWILSEDAKYRRSETQA